jgi:hypothetical protein
MTQAEARSPKEIQISIRESRNFRRSISCFGLRQSSFVRHSCFVLRHLLPIVTVIGASAAPMPLALHSRSGQFIVSGMPIMTANYVSSSNAVSFVRLDPALAAVSCEKIKWALLDELGLRDQWQGTIMVSIRAAFQDNEFIDITSAHYRNGWKYRLNVPDQVDRSRFIRAVVEALVFEIANRRAGSRPAELPPWLVIGLAKYLETTSLAGLTLEPHSALIAKGRTADALARVRKTLEANRGLTIDELNWPNEELQKRDQALYESCAHLLVHELLRSRNGRVCMVDMLKRLHQSLNWQTTFFQSFGNHFERLADLDKWWSSRLAQFSPNQFVAIPVREQVLHLEKILATTAARRDTNEAAHVTLQNVITEWEPARQTAFIQQTAQLLHALQSQADSPTRLLIGEYLTVLSEYLSKQHSAQVHLGRSAPLGANRRMVTQATIRRLNELDAQRETFKERPQASVEHSPSP